MSNKVAINNFEEYYEKKQKGEVKVFDNWNTIFYLLSNDFIVQDTNEQPNITDIAFDVELLSWDSGEGDRFVEETFVTNQMKFRQKGVYNIEFQLVFNLPLDDPNDPNSDNTSFMYGILFNDERTEEQPINYNLSRFEKSQSDPNLPYVVTCSKMTRYFDVSDYFELWYNLVGPTGRKYEILGEIKPNGGLRSEYSYLRITKLY